MKEKLVIIEELTKEQLNYYAVYQDCDNIDEVLFNKASERITMYIIDNDIQYSQINVEESKFIFNIEDETFEYKLQELLNTEMLLAIAQDYKTKYKNLLKRFESKNEK